MKYLASLLVALLMAVAPAGSAPTVSAPRITTPSPEMVSVTDAAPPSVDTPGYPGCIPDHITGLCLETLPKLWCCSAAFLGWSEILVGDRFVVAGRVAMAGEEYARLGGPEEEEPSLGKPRAESLEIRFPSGKAVRLAIGPDGRFRQEISFDEEGHHRLVLLNPGNEWVVAGFTVAYRATLVDLPTVEQGFGKQHRRSALTMGLVEADQTTQIKIRFTDAKGEPVREKALVVGFWEQLFKTDRDGIAVLNYQSKHDGGYSLDRLYPGLAVTSYRNVQVEADGTVRGLPGGVVKAVAREGVWYLPLRESLAKAAPWRFGDLPERFEWDAANRLLHFAGRRLMVDTGLLLGHRDLRVDLYQHAGETMIALDSFVELLDEIGMAIKTGEASFQLGMEEEP